jgi:predicted nucleotidyltransferase
MLERRLIAPLLALQGFEQCWLEAFFVLGMMTHRTEVREIVLAHRTVNARVFGSVARGTDSDESDLDILVDTTPDTTLFDLGAIRFKLRKLLGVPVDVLTPEALPEKFRYQVIAEAQPV